MPDLLRLSLAETTGKDGFYQVIVRDLGHGRWVEIHAHLVGIQQGAYRLRASHAKTKHEFLACLLNG